MSSEILFSLIIALTGVERLYEMYVSKRNAAWSFANGGKEYGFSHYPFMVVLHTGFLLACVLEVFVMNRTFNPFVGYSLIVMAVLAQVFRWWCINTLGQRWNTRVIIVPGLPRVTGGPYQWFSHPNYIAVVAEGLILPLIHNAYLTAIGFTLLNGALLTVRVSIENKALQDMESVIDDIELPTTQV